MKNFFVIGLSAFILSHTAIDSASANDSAITCYSTGVADVGYSFWLATNRKTAKLSEQTIAGPRNPIEMTCEFVPGGRDLNGFHNTVVCRDMRAMEGGLRVRLYEGGRPFRRAARVLESMRDGHGFFEKEVKYGALTCPL